MDNVWVGIAGTLAGAVVTHILGLVREGREAKRKKEERTEEWVRQRTDRLDEKLSEARAAFFLAYDRAHTAALAAGHFGALAKVAEAVDGSRTEAARLLRQTASPTLTALRDAGADLRREYTRLLVLEPDPDLRAEILSLQGCLLLENSILETSNSPRQIWESAQRDAAALQAGYSRFTALLQTVAERNAAGLLLPPKTSDGVTRRTPRVAASEAGSGKDADRG